MSTPYHAESEQAAVAWTLGEEASAVAYVELCLTG